MTQQAVEKTKERIEEIIKGLVHDIYESDDYWERKHGNTPYWEVGSTQLLSLIDEEKGDMKYGEPLSTFIQWKGTDLCMDWFCEDGHQNHIDGDFIYEMACETCHKAYELGTMIKLKPISVSQEK